VTSLPCVGSRGKRNSKKPCAKAPAVEHTRSTAARLGGNRKCDSSFMLSRTFVKSEGNGKWVLSAGCPNG